MKSETKKLLDRLYNLRGNDSVVLFDIEQESKTAEQTRDSAEKEKKELETSIEKLAYDANILEEQGERLKNILKTLNQEDFSVIVDRLHLDFNPESISEKINESLPGTIAAVANEKKEAEAKLSEVENTMDSAITTLEELTIRRDEAVENQGKLNEFIELALSGNSNLTRDSITELLAKFKFNKDEQREAAKLLMFPEDGLFEYEQKVEAGTLNGKSISDVFHEAKEVEEKPEQPVEPKVEIFSKAEPTFIEPVIIKDEPTFDKIEPEPTSIVKEAPTPDFIESTITPIEIVDPVKTIELSGEIEKEDVKSVLRECGFNINDFSNQDINAVKDNFDVDIIKKNVEYVTKLGINKAIFTDNVELLYDKDLIIKIDILTNAGKTATDIYLNPNVLIKYTKEELNDTISSLKSSGLDPAMVPLMAF